MPAHAAGLGGDDRRAARRHDVLAGVTAVEPVDDLTFRASERPESLFRSDLSVGIPRAGSIAFEIPAELVDRPAVLRLATDDDTRLDSVMEIAVDLGALERDGEAELADTGWAER